MPGYRIAERRTREGWEGLLFVREDDRVTFSVEFLGCKVSQTDLAGRCASGCWPTACDELPRAAACTS